MPTDLLTTKQAAERLGLTVFQFHYRANRRGLAPAAQGDGVRGPKFWRPADVDALASTEAEAAA